MGEIRWPSGPFRIRRRPLGGVGKFIAWLNILAGAAVLVFLAQENVFQQYGLNLLASLGLGETVAEARVEKRRTRRRSGRCDGTRLCRRVAQRLVGLGRGGDQRGNPSAARRGT